MQNGCKGGEEGRRSGASMLLLWIGNCHVCLEYGISIWLVREFCLETEKYGIIRYKQLAKIRYIRRHPALSHHMRSFSSSAQPALPR